MEPQIGAQRKQALSEKDQTGWEHPMDLGNRSCWLSKLKINYK